MAASGSSSSAPSLAALPDDLLVACFEQLEDPLERRRLLPSVCSRWRRLADAPELVRSFSIHCRLAGSFPRLAAFRRWAERSGAAAAVRSLRLEAGLLEGIDPILTAEFVRMHKQLMRIAAACSGLQELRVESYDLPLPEFDVSRLAGALPSLRQLHLFLPDTTLLLQAALGSQSQLLDLRLQGRRPVRLGPAAALPPALTRLRLGGSSDTLRRDDLPRQIGLLTRLEHLHLEELDCGQDNGTVLSRLGRLTALELNCCDRMPPPEVLRPLTSLRALGLSTYDESAAGRAEVDAAMCALPQLTALYLQLTTPLPPAMAGLAQLQRFAWSFSRTWSFSSTAPLAALPAGPWLASLRRLALLGMVTVGALDVLQAATQLEHLGLSRVSYADQGDAARLARCAQSHPTLQQVQLRAGSLGRRALRRGAPRVSVSVLPIDDDLVHAVVPELVEGFFPLYD